MTVSRARLHDEGPELSGLVWGLWRAHVGQASERVAALAAMLRACVEHGITTFDLAPVYGAYTTEALFGEALRRSGLARGEIELISKCGIELVTPNRPANRVKHYDTTAAAIVRSVERTLDDLATDRLDLLLVHRPDPLMDADETADALDRLVADGKVRALGVSNFQPPAFALLQSRLARPLVTNQLRFSVTQHATLTDGTLEDAQLRRLRPMAWSPLGGGAIGDPKDPSRLGVALREIAAEIGAPGPATVALAWVLRHPARPVPVLGTGRPDRLPALIAATELALDRQQWFRLLEAASGRDVA